VNGSCPQKCHRLQYPKRLRVWWIVVVVGWMVVGLLFNICSEWQDLRREEGGGGGGVVVVVRRRRIYYNRLMWRRRRRRRDEAEFAYDRFGPKGWCCWCTGIRLMQQSVCYQATPQCGNAMEQPRCENAIITVTLHEQPPSVQMFKQLD
jgi:hypothetical protein